MDAFTLCVLSHFSCIWLCIPMDCSPPGSSVHGILQARILECVAMPSSRGSSQHRDWICVSYVSGTGRQVLYHSTWEARASCPTPKWMNTFRHDMKSLETQSSTAFWPYIYIFFLSQHLAIKILGLNTRWACASLCIVSSSITFLSPPDGSLG